MLSKKFYNNKAISQKEYNIISETITFLKSNYIETKDVGGNIVKADKQTAKKLKDHYTDLTNSIYDNRKQITNNIKFCNKKSNESNNSNKLLLSNIDN